VETDLYPHMPIADPTSTRRAIFRKPQISSVTFTLAHHYCNVYIPEGVARELGSRTGRIGQRAGHALAARGPARVIDSSDFGFLGAKFPKMCLALNADESLCKM